MRPILFELLLALQAFHVLFLLLHDWIPLGTLNNISAVRAENSLTKLLIATLVSSSFFLFGFLASIPHLHGPYPHWLLLYLAISYVLLFVGELQAWWIPYFGRTQPERVTRYKVMFAGTHSFLPARNGITINTLHVILHAATVTTLLVLAACWQTAAPNIS